MKIEYVKQQKELYAPPKKPVTIDVPMIPFLMLDGAGDPNSEQYQQAVQTLYAVMYTIKMGCKQEKGYMDFAVPPLEGLWWCKGDSFDLYKRDNWLWTSMIRLPDFVTDTFFDTAIALATRKKPTISFTNVRKESFTEGLCVQMMHIGPYATEPTTVADMHAYMAQNGLQDEVGLVRKHHEIYLSDPRKAQPEKMKTILRHPVR